MYASLQAILHNVPQAFPIPICMGDARMQPYLPGPSPSYNPFVPRMVSRLALSISSEVEPAVLANALSRDVMALLLGTGS